MVKCPKCNKELNEGTNFCDSCGTQIPKTIVCATCGQSVNSEYAFCQNCGASLKPTNSENSGDNVQKESEQAIAQPATEQTATEQVAEQQEVFEQSKQEQPTQEQPKQEFFAPVTQKNKKKTVTYAVAAVAVLLIAVFLISLLFGGESSNVFYLKDGEIYTAEKNGNPWQVTENFVGTKDYDNEKLASLGYSIGAVTSITEDGKYVFFPDKLSDEGYSLYYKEIGKPKSEAVKVDSAVKSYSIDANVITYIKGDDKRLYQVKIGDDSAEKIDSNVNLFSVSDDGKKICYFTTEDTLYYKDGTKDKEKIASDITDGWYVNDSLTVVYYVKEEALYKQVIGKDKEKLTSDVQSIIKIYESGEMYYLKNADGEATLMDYVDDDMKAKDDAITEPESPTYPTSPKYPSYSDYGSYAEYSAAYEEYKKEYSAWQDECTRLREEYSEARTAYNEKKTRDTLRENLESRTVDQKSYTLCYYNGKEEKVVTDAFLGGYLSEYSYSTENAVIAYKENGLGNFEKIKFSEIKTVSEVAIKLEEAQDSSSERYIAIKETPTLLEQEKEISGVKINSDGTRAIYIDNISDDHGDLYSVSISKNKVGTPELYDTDVYDVYYYFVGDGDIRYFKNCEDSTCDLYINQQEVESDVYIYGITTDTDRTFYVTDWNSDKSYGTLKTFNGKKSEVIAEEVSDFYVLDEGRVLYLSDYSSKYYKGELNEWNNGKTRKIDDDVSCIVHAVFLGD